MKFYTLLLLLFIGSTFNLKSAAEPCPIDRIENIAIGTIKPDGKPDPAITEQQALAVFNIPKGTSFNDIKKLYRKLSLACHPDKFSGADEDQQKRIGNVFATIAEAFNFFKTKEEGGSKIKEQLEKSLQKVKNRLNDEILKFTDALKEFDLIYKRGADTSIELHKLEDLSNLRISTQEIEDTKFLITNPTTEFKALSFEEKEQLETEITELKKLENQYNNLFIQATLIALTINLSKIRIQLKGNNKAARDIITNKDYSEDKINKILKNFTDIIDNSKLKNLLLNAKKLKTTFQTQYTQQLVSLNNQYVWDIESIINNYEEALSDATHLQKELIKIIKGKEESGKNILKKQTDLASLTAELRYLNERL